MSRKTSNTRAILTALIALATPALGGCASWLPLSSLAKQVHSTVAEPPVLVEEEKSQAEAAANVEESNVLPTQVESLALNAARRGDLLHQTQQTSYVDPELLPADTERAMPENRSADEHPIDLANALALGGANHLQIEMARERVVEAHANWMGAWAQWMPSLRFGVGWNKHDGRLQETGGNVLQINRNSLFVGGGAGLGNAPLAGGAGGPARLMVSLSLADAIFAPWIAERSLQAVVATEDAVVNNSLLEIALAYFNLLEVHGLRANAEQGLKSADQMVKLTTDFADEGAGSQAEVDRAKTEQAFWRQSVENAKRNSIAKSVELSRLLRLDPRTALVPGDEKVLPIELIDPDTALDLLIEQGLASRPELVQQEAIVEAASERMNQEHWRPWLPSVQAGASAGTFGGGPSSTFTNQSGRSDVDLMAVWELQNLGFGTAAQRGRRSSQLQQTIYQAEWVRDRVISEIVTATGDVSSYRRQMQATREGVQAATSSYRRNFQRVREAEGLPIELLQSIRARGSAMDAVTKAVAEYNRAQFRLLRAVGRPPEASADDVQE